MFRQRTFPEQRAADESPDGCRRPLRGAGLSRQQPQPCRLRDHHARLPHDDEVLTDGLLARRAARDEGTAVTNGLLSGRTARDEGAAGGRRQAETED